MVEPDVVWTPDPDRIAASDLDRFRTWLRARGHVDATTYDELWQWSVADPGQFWAAFAEYAGVRFRDHSSTPLTSRSMPQARWFPGATLNYAEHALATGDGRGDHDIAVIFRREDGLRRQLTYGELRDRVAAARTALARSGVRRGDRVVALAPNSPETLVAFLATASLGAIWSSCSPDFGVRAVVDRFSQLEPSVLFTVDGYVYNGRSFPLDDTTARLHAELPSLHTTVVVPFLGTGAGHGPGGGVTGWPEFLSRGEGGRLDVDPVPFDHPLWVLYSSGTTGLPKGIVHSHGGITLEHLKALRLHFDAGPGDQFFWFTTTGWMMWNFLISGLLVGSTVVLYDGSPAYPSLHALWQLADDEDVTVFGTSAPFIQACRKEGLDLAGHDISSIRTVGTTGAPLSVDGFQWLADNLGSTVQIASFSGGTDLCTGFIGPAPDVPVWLGELSRPTLGAAVAAYNDQGRPVVGEVGELVLTEPMPSMPVALWNDPDGTKLRDTYFSDFPGIWRHGDWITITERGSAVIHGRSDSTLNRGGVRMGTAEFYRVVEAHPGVIDSLVIDTSGGGNEDGQLWCFLVLADEAQLDQVAADLRASLRAELSPRHVPDRFVAVTDVPRTLNGKKCEVPVKKILTGADPDRAISRDALSNPSALDAFLDLADEAASR